MKRNCPIPHLQSAQPLRWAVHEADQIIQLGVCCIALIGSGHRGYMATTAVCIIKRSKAEQLDSWMHAKAAGYHQSGPSLTPAKGNHRSTPVFLYTFVEDIAVTRQLEVLVIQVGLCRDGARTQTKSLTERSVFVWIPLLKRKWDREVSKGLVEVKTRARIGYRCPAIRFRAHNSLLLQVLVAADPKSASVRKRRLHTRYKCVWRSWIQLEFGSRCGLIWLSLWPVVCKRFNCNQDPTGHHTTLLCAKKKVRILSIASQIPRNPELNCKLYTHPIEHWDNVP